MSPCSFKPAKMATPSAPPPLLPWPPLPLRNSRVRVSTLSFSIHLLLLLFIISPSPCYPAKISYADHCNSVVPESARSETVLIPLNSIRIQNGYFSGGNKLFSDDPSSTFSFPRAISFRTREVYQTEEPKTFGLKGTLVFRGGSIGVWRRNLTEVRSLLARVRSPRVFRGRGTVKFDLSGFWSESTGKLCLVGSGISRSRGGTYLDLSAVLKLDYPKNSTINNSFVRGTVESLDEVISPNYFDRISILAYSQNNYEYTLIPHAKKLSADMGVVGESLGLGSENSICTLFSYGGGFRLEYTADCLKKGCGPFDGNIGYLPSFVSLGGLECSGDGRLHSYIEFSNTSYFAYNKRFVPDLTLVGEGVWDHEKNRLFLLACRVLKSRDSLEKTSVEDCSIRFSLWFPSVLSLKNRSRITGRIWSGRSVNDSNYFETISFQSMDPNMVSLPSVKYQYTEMDRVKRLCKNNDIRNLIEQRFPDGKSIQDLSFQAFVRDSDGRSAWGYGTPLSLGETWNDNIFRLADAPVTAHKMANTNHSLFNISYQIYFSNTSSNLQGLRDISAEGIYNSETGIICMIGCRHVASSISQGQIQGTDSQDCEILIQIQLTPLDPEPGEKLNGIIRSLRNNSDPLHFKPLEISSYTMYEKQAAESVWRMNLEITIVLISLTLSCVFIGSQLLYMKKHPDVLASISLTMLVVLTLGHMIPLVLNFEAMLFMNHNKQNILVWSGGWHDANEVIVRVITMVAFLLQLRFLQLVWSARLVDERRSVLWVSERKSIQLCLPLYFVGALIAWHVQRTSYKAPAVVTGPPASRWEDLISYAGLVLDGFLLPQVIMNIFWNSKDKALFPAFYVGTTVVRALPHVYDAYRARHYMPYFTSSYIYASPDGDFFSSVWDIIIPCEGLVFAVLIYLQQRFGGSCILPPRYRNPDSRGWKPLNATELVNVREDGDPCT